VLGIDLSPQMVGQCRARNAQAVRTGRLQLRRADVRDLVDPADLMVAVHVLYFWHDPASVLQHARTILAGGGEVALGYRCRQDMPAAARRDFPREGHRLYDSEHEVSALLAACGFDDVQNHAVTSDEDVLGWLTVGQSR
jgi:SAM-dependent methyltransferase